MSPPPPERQHAAGAADGRSGKKDKERENEPSVNLPRRACQILLNLCDGPEAFAAMRPYEGVLMHLAMHDTGGAAQFASELLELLCER